MRRAVLLAAATPGLAQQPLVPALEMLAAKGDADALYHLGMAHQVGADVPIDHGRALAYFRQAAAKGQPLAAYKLGCFYAGRDGVIAPDPQQALRYKLVAAEAGYALAQGDVAGLYAARGEPARAAEWIARAAAQGTGDALMGMAALHDGKNGLPRDGAVVVAYFTLYLDRGGGSDQQRAWLAHERSALTLPERARADAIIAGYQPRPTALTLLALSGRRAAEALVASAAR